jgi:hypothetical protein
MVKPLLPPRGWPALGPVPSLQHAVAALCATWTRQRRPLRQASFWRLVETGRAPSQPEEQLCAAAGQGLLSCLFAAPVPRVGTIF